jgi:hypothetical protein
LIIKEKGRFRNMNEEMKSSMTFQDCGVAFRGRDDLAGTLRRSTHADA